jgi:hypothetical protein
VSGLPIALLLVALSAAAFLFVAYRQERLITSPNVAVGWTALILLPIGIGAVWLAVRLVQ